MERARYNWIVAHGRLVRLTGESRKKDDRLDAQTLARLAPIDPELLCPVKHRSAPGAGGSERDSSASWTGPGARPGLVNTRGLEESYGERSICNQLG